MKSANEPVIKAWVRLVRAHRAAMTGVETALKAAGFPPLAWYDALLELRRAPNGLRLQELQACMLLPQHDISRLADRLQTAGYAVKKMNPEDARSRILVITKKGRSLLKAMWPVYAWAIEEAVGIKLSKSDANRLAGLLRKIAGDAG